MFKTWQTRRSHGPIPIVKLIFRDGAIYFAIITLSNGANIMTYWVCGPFMKGGLSTFAGCISAVMMSRLMLNLHSAGNLGLYSSFVPGGQGTTSATPSQFPHTVELDTLWTADLDQSTAAVSASLPGADIGPGLEFREPTPTTRSTSTAVSTA
ncbi:hypothetical protein H0H81_004244 [Sphagnurus paluster]|uniref:Uncharacterized protein n=1 Tax=Sphagnurus paluster TaxID=117069 RepID=A0A9P7KK17_9AGAR|nr:hypothetical protein H0H81_004244 [Sphagnurus paluster]